uniref:Solute carrier family 26 member 6 n=1 Tax=Scleropages formosus TaxID=113540 RepID=A0A8C9STF0_SCLFO
MYSRQTLVDVLVRVSKSSPGTLVVSALSAAALVGGKMLNSRFKSRLPTPVPWELFVIILATVLSAHLNLAQEYSVQTIGRIPTGLSAPSLPPLEQFRELLAPALALAVVGFGFTVSLGKVFALKHGYSVDSNQELLALGLSNCIGGVFQCFAVGGSITRSLVQESTGGKTQLAGAVSSLVILVVLLRLGGVFEQLPKAVLAVVIVVNLHGIFGQAREVSSLWASDRLDLLVWVLTLVFTLLFNLDLGLVASIGFSLLTVIFRTQNPRCAVLGRIPETDCYRDRRLYSKAAQIPGVTVFSCSGALYFANADLYFSVLREEVQRGREGNAASSESLRGGAAGHCLILDLGAVAFMDSASVNTLRATVKDMKEQGIAVCLAACPDALRRQLRAQLFDPALGLLIFPSVHHAVQHRRISTQSFERSTCPSGSSGDLWE